MRVEGQTIGQGPDGRSALLWTAVFAAYTLARLAFHEMWRDELNIWAGAVDSRTLGDMMSGVRHGGHGNLWAAVLWVVARVCPAPEMMQGISAALAVAYAWLLFRFAPCRRLWCVLLVFGYYFGFEYAVISRTYGVGILCLTAAVVLLTRNPARILAGFACLAVAANTTVYAAILALAIGAGWGLHHWKEAAGVRIRLRVAGGVGILAAGACFAAWCMLPPPDTGFAVEWYFRPDPVRLMVTAMLLWRAFFPVPTAGLHFWNSNILDTAPAFSALLGAVLFAGVTWRFRRHIAALACWLLGAGGILAFSYLKYAGFQRHQGHLFLALLAAAWLARWQTSQISCARNAAITPAGGVWVSFLWLVVIVQFACGVYASCLDIVHPFSASAQTAEWIRRKHFDRRLIIADVDSIVTPVLARLDRPRLLYARGWRTQRMITWDKVRLAPVPESELVALVRQRAAGESAPPLLITTYPLSSQCTSLQLEASFGPGIVESERYFLYTAAGTTSSGGHDQPNRRMGDPDPPGM